MNLHEDREKLNQAVLLVAETLKMHPAIVEKDYFVTLILKKIVEQEPHVVFKGGTSIKSKIVCKFLSYYRPEHCHLDYPARRSPVKGKGYASASRTLDWMPDFAGDSC